MLTRNDDIAKTEHGELPLGRRLAFAEERHAFDEVLWPKDFDRGIKVASDRDHHVRAENPKDIVCKQSTKHDSAGSETVQTH